MHDLAATLYSYAYFLWSNALRSPSSICVAAFGLSVFRMSDQTELPLLGSIIVRVEPGGTASSPPQPREVVPASSTRQPSVEIHLPSAQSPRKPRNSREP